MAEQAAFAPVVFMPDGRPAPYVLTEAELITFLRIEARFPKNTIRRYRDDHGLPAVQVGKNVRFKLPDVIAWLERQQDRNPR